MDSERKCKRFYMPKTIYRMVKRCGDINCAMAMVRAYMQTRGLRYDDCENVGIRTGITDGGVYWSENYRIEYENQSRQDKKRKGGLK